MERNIERNAGINDDHARLNIISSAVSNKKTLFFLAIVPNSSRIGVTI